MLIARYDGEPAGSAGVRLLDGATAELTRVFLYEPMRGRGGAPLLVRAAEDAAGAPGAARPAGRDRHRTGPHNDDRYAEHWFSKELG